MFLCGWNESTYIQRHDDEYFGMEWFEVIIKGDTKDKIILFNLKYQYSLSLGWRIFFLTIKPM